MVVIFLNEIFGLDDEFIDKFGRVRFLNKWWVVFWWIKKLLMMVIGSLVIMGIGRGVNM